MPKIAQYGEQQVSTQVVQGARAQELPVSAFPGAAMGQAVQAMGQGAADLMQRVDQTRAEESAVAFEREKNDLFFNPETGYFNTQGRNAYENASAIAEQLEELKTRYSGELESPNARQMFDRVAQQHMTRAQTDIARHASRGQQSWEVATANAVVDNAIDNAVMYWMDPNEMGVQLALGEQQILKIAEIEGVGAEMIENRKQTFRSSFAMAAVNGALSNGTADDAQKLFDNYSARGLFKGPDEIKTQYQIQKVRNQIEKKREAESTGNSAAFAISNANSIMDAGYDQGLSAMLEMTRQIEDPELQKSTQSEVKRMYDLKRKGDQDQQASIFENAETMINNGMMTGRQWVASNPEEYAKLSQKQRRMIMNNELAVTNPGVFNALNEMTVNELAQVDVNKFADQLSPEDRKDVANRVDNARQGKFDTLVQTNAKMMTLAAKNLSLNDEREKEFYGSMQNLINQATNDKGSPLTTQEVQTIIDTATTDFVINRPFYEDGKIWLSDTKVRAKKVPPEEMFALNQLAGQLGDTNVIRKRLYEVRNDLIEAGYPVNYRYMSEAYKRKFKGNE